MPAFMLIVPPAAEWLVAQGGTHLLYWVLAGSFALLLPILMLLIERPEDVGQTTLRSAAATDAGPVAVAPPMTSRQIWVDSRFWLLSLGIGVLTGCGTSRAMGLSYLVKVPFLFGLTPLAGHLYDVAGNYRTALALVCGLIGVALALFVALRIFAGAARRSLRRANRS